MTANFSCIEYSLSFQHEKKTFSDLVQNGKNVIFINLISNHSAFNLLSLQEMKSKKWIWLAQDFQYLLSLPQDVDVFSFGLLKVKRDALDIQITFQNLTEVCKLNFDIYLANYLSDIMQSNSNTMNTTLEASKGHTCFTKIETNYARDLISNISGVKIGFPFRCYLEKNTFVLIEKSYVTYIVISIIFFVYSFYPIFIEMAYYIEDRKPVDGNYYMSDSPYSPSIICKRVIFSGNSKYFATLRIIIILMLLTGLVYKLKSEIYDWCDCSIEVFNDIGSFQDAENLYKSSSVAITLGVIYFIFVHVCVFLNSNGNLDDFVFINLISLGNCSRTFVTTLEVSVFISPPSTKGNPVPYKIKKLSLFFSYRFWTQVLLLNFHTKPDYSFLYLLYPIQVLFNFGLASCNILCPVVFNICALFTKIKNAILSKYVFTKFDAPCNLILELIFNLISQGFAIAYLTCTYIYSFNIFFNGISYIIQFAIYTLFLAVPRFQIQTYIYVIFITSIIIYISRFVYQFTKLYKNLLETILEVQDQKSIPIKHFNKIVERYFPLHNEVLYLLVKIVLSIFFFAIIFNTMQKVGYIRFGAQPDLTTIISLIFLFGPPRLVELLLIADFTSRVHMKEKDIKADIKALANNKELQSVPNLVQYTKTFELCGKYQNDGIICTLLRYVCTLFCGCFQCSVNEKGFCECCVLLTSDSKQHEGTIVSCPTICLYKRPVSENEEGSNQNNTENLNNQNRMDTNGQNLVESNVANLGESNDQSSRESNAANVSGSNDRNSNESNATNSGGSNNQSASQLITLYQRTSNHCYSRSDCHNQSKRKYQYFSRIACKNKKVQIEEIKMPQITERNYQKQSADQTA